MIRSMTGYGSAERELADGSLAVEIRSVNSRHLKLSLRLPDGAEAWEPGLRELLGARLGRGHVDVRVEAAPAGAAGSAWELDEGRVEAYLTALETLREKYRLPGHADLSVLASLGDILRPRRREEVEWLAEAELREAAGEALAALLEMREREGARLEEDLRGRVAAIRERAERVRELAPERLERERDRLRAAVEELSEGVGLDDERLAREIAVLAEKWDIGEEVVRTASHLDAFEEFLDAPASEPVGKRLAFLVQELHREINTMGAKANDTRISREVVEMKNELERLREQVENVE